MWSSFASLAMGLRLRLLDWALMGCILLLVPPVVWSRQSLADSGSPLVAVRYLQFASPFLLAVPAAMGVALYRISREMGEGLMAIALRCLAASFAIRLMALVITTAGPSPRTQVVLTITAHWVFLLGLAYRCRFSRETHELIERYESDREAQLALLSSKKTVAGQQTGALRQH
jgi:hypothetical protein